MAAKSAEQEHLQALQQAAAEARRGRRQLKLKMQELDQAVEQIEPLEAVSAAVRSSAAVARASAVRQAEAEAQHLQALQEAAAQARRDRKEILARRQENGQESGGDAVDVLSQGLAKSAEAQPTSDWDCYSPAREPEANAQRDRKATTPEQHGELHSPPAAADFDKTRPRSISRSPLGFVGGLMAGAGLRPRPHSLDVRLRDPASAARSVEGLGLSSGRITSSSEGCVLEAQSPPREASADVKAASARCLRSGLGVTPAPRLTDRLCRSAPGEPPRTSAEPGADPSTPPPATSSGSPLLARPPVEPRAGIGVALSGRSPPPLPPRKSVSPPSSDFGWPAAARLAQIHPRLLQVDAGGTATFGSLSYSDFTSTLSALSCGIAAP